MNFNYIQSFIIKKDSVFGAPYVFLTSIDLYFRNKPPSLENNSGVEFPGVSVYICPFKDDQPSFTNVLQNEFARTEWGAISAFADASIATNFKFETPIVLEPDVFYGFAVKFDDNDFVLAGAVQNEFILNSNRVYSGTSGEGDGKFYLPSSDAELKPLPDRDLKFNINIAKFSANTAEITTTNDNHEFLTVSNMSSNPKFQGGEIVFQNFGLQANATVNTVYSRAGLITGSTVRSKRLFGSNTTFTTDYAENDFILLTSTTDSSEYDIVQVASIESDTEITLKKKFRQRVAEGSKYHTPVVTATVQNKDNLKNKVILSNSSASNSTIRFFTNAVTHFTISNPGGSYSNNDTIRVSNGVINAAARIITNASGNVVSIRLITPGDDFPNASHSVTTITTSTGSGANITPTIGAPLKGENSGATATIVNLYDLPIDVLDSKFKIIGDSTSTITSQIATTNSTNYTQSFITFQNNRPRKLNKHKARVLSRSRELRNSTNLLDADISFAVKTTISVNNANTTTNPLFYAPYFFEDDCTLIVFENDIDPTTDDVSDEIGRGNASSKHITTKMVFANNMFAEDLLVYMDAYKPANTEILVFAKLHNSTDPEPADDKSWSPMIIKEGVNIFSAADSLTDVKPYTYGFPQFPNVEFTCTGTGKSEISNNVILTTADLTSNLAANDLVRVYNPLFSTTNYTVSPVQSVNSTAVVLTSTISNNGLVGSGLKIDKMRFKNAAYNNILNDNVARYYNTTMVPYDKYDSVALKMVFLSDDSNISPEIDKIRVIGVSA